MTAVSLELGQAPIDKAAQSDDDLVLYSVTTIIGVLEKRALLYWSAEQAAREAVRIAGSLPQRIEEDGEETVVKWLRDARFRQPKDRLSSTALGTVFHSLAETYALTGDRPGIEAIAHAVTQEGIHDGPAVNRETDVLAAMLDRFDEWLQRFQPSYRATEVTVYSPTYGYAGTCDGFLTIDGTPLIVDYKSSREPYDSKGRPKTPYPESALQLAAYRHAEFAAVWRPRRTEKWYRRYYLLGPAERQMAAPVPDVDGGLVIHVTPEACEAFPVRCDETVWTAFAYLIEAFRWVQETSKTAIGPPLEEATP